MNFIFLLGVFLMPFDNFAFAPSKGWAAISPYFFLLYATLSIFTHKQINKKLALVLLFLFFIVIYSLFRYMEFQPEINLVLRNIFSLLVGFSFLLSLHFYLHDRFNYIKTDNIDQLAKTVLYAYSVSLIYGLVFIVSFKLGISPIVSLYELIQSRDYGARFQFSFTEPSFASIHLYGILFFFIYFFIVNNAKIEYVNKLSILFFAYVLLAFIFIDSARFKLDTVFFFSVLFFVYFVRKNIFLTVSLYTFLFLFIYFGGSYVLELLIPNRFNADSGVLNLINSDPSLAARFFRISAIYNGTLNDLSILFMGTGISNAWHAFMAGYQDSINAYTNAYMAEVEELGENITSNYFNMPVRLVAEYGIFITSFILYYLYSKHLWWLYFLLLYIYIQFDSYAFYLVWLYLYIIFFSNCFSAPITTTFIEKRKSLFFLTTFFYKVIK